jgi:hypothetical protein
MDINIYIHFGVNKKTIWGLIAGIVKCINKKPSEVNQTSEGYDYHYQVLSQFTAFTQ